MTKLLSNIKLVLFLLWILELPLCTWGQSYHIHHYGKEVGLSQGNITFIGQEQSGHLWIGTSSGLNRYDGVKFKDYYPKLDDPFSVSGIQVNNSLVDSKGRFWVAFENGLNCYNPKDGKFHLINELHPFIFPKLNLDFESKDGHIWLSQGNQLIELLVPDDFPFRNPNPCRIGLKVHSNQIDNKEVFQAKSFNNVEEEVGVVLDNGTHYFTYLINESGINTKYLKYSDNLLQGDRFKYLYYVQDSTRKGAWTYYNNNIQFRSKTGRKVLFDLSIKKRPTRKDPMLPKSMVLDESGDLWLVIENELYHINVSGSVENLKINSQKIEFANHSSPSISYLYLDIYNNLWVGTSGFGLYKIEIFDFKFMNFMALTSSYLIRNFDGDIDHIYVRNAHKIFKVEKTTYLDRGYVPTTLAGGYTTDFIIAKNGDQIYREFVPPSSYFLNIIYSNQRPALRLPIEPYELSDIMYEDSRGYIWLLSRLGEWSWLNNTHNKIMMCSVPINITSFDGAGIPIQIIEAVDSTIYIGGNKGLTHIKRPVFSKNDFRLDLVKEAWEPLKINIKSILADPKEPSKYLWLGTNSLGLVKLNIETGAQRIFNKENGLPNNVIYGLLSDSLGRIWMSTNEGLAYIEKDHSQIAKFSDKVFFDGKEFNTLSYSKSKDGLFYFGGLNGVYTFKPETIHIKKCNNKPWFNNLLVNNVQVTSKDSSGILTLPIELTDHLVLNYDQNFLTLNFTSLCFMDDKTSFEYKMDGVDRDWVRINEGQGIHYSKLASGSYKLALRPFMESDASKTRTLSIKVAYPWWKHPIAYIIYGLIILFIFYLLSRYQARMINLQNSYLSKQKEAEELKIANDAKIKFFTNIAHEIKTPLSLIVEPLKLANEVSEPKAKEKFNNIVLKNIERLSFLISQLLDVPKLDQGVYTPNLYSFDLCILIKDLELYYAYILESKKISFSVISDRKEFIVHTDKGLMEKILHNLIYNAYKFTPENGTISIYLNTISDALWEVLVRDNGIGISKDEQALIFDRFYQTKDLSYRKVEGVGIGLSLVKEYVKLLNGEISLISELGKGSSFRLLFEGHEASQPINSSVAKPLENNLHEKLEESKEDLHPYTESLKTILIIDDHPEIIDYLSSVLDSTKYKVAKALNGKSGYELAVDILPDLIISDVMMPEMDGYELLERIRTNRVVSHIPVILLTAMIEQDQKAKAFQLGAEYILNKPFDTHELLAKINQLFQQSELLKNKILTKSSQSSHNALMTTTIENQGESLVFQNEMETQEYEWIENLKKLVRDKILEGDLRTDELHTLLFMNRTQYYAKVKALTGQTPSTLIKEIRMEVAYQMISQRTDLRISDVVTQLGLSDTKNFSKLFKDKFGVSPRDIKPKRKY